MEERCHWPEKASCLEMGRGCGGAVSVALRPTEHTRPLLICFRLSPLPHSSSPTFISSRLQPCWITYASLNLPSHSMPLCLSNCSLFCLAFPSHPLFDWTILIHPLRFTWFVTSSGKHFLIHQCHYSFFLYVANIPNIYLYLPKLNKYFWNTMCQVL